MADDQSSPGFLSNLMSGVGGLLGLKDDPNAQKQGETVADYATRRQDNRFAVMKQEVDGLLQRYPATAEFPDADAFHKEVQGIRQRGFNQQEEDAIIHTFTHTHGERAGNLQAALEGGVEEGQNPGLPAAGGGAPSGTNDVYNRANPPLPPGVKMPQGPLQQRDIQVMNKLIENYNKSGRSPSYVQGKDKKGRPMMFRDSGPGFET